MRPHDRDTTTGPSARTESLPSSREASAVGNTRGGGHGRGAPDPDQRAVAAIGWRKPRPSWRVLLLAKDSPSAGAADNPYHAQAIALVRAGIGAFVHRQSLG